MAAVEGHDRHADRRSLERGPEPSFAGRHPAQRLFVGAVQSAQLEVHQDLVDDERREHAPSRRAASVPWIPPLSNTP